MNEKTTVSSVMAKMPVIGNSLLSLLSGLLASFLILYSSYVLYDSVYTQANAGNTWDLLKYKPEIITDNPTPLAGAEVLSTINEDYRGWISVYDTTIDYPIMQSTDNLYYANHDIYKNQSLTGAIYMAAENTSDITDEYVMLYGHHMDSAAMFGALDRYVEKDFFDAHKTGVVVSKNALYDIEAFAVIKTDAYNGSVYTVGPSVSKDNVLNYIKGNPEDSEILILDEKAMNGCEKVLATSTCASTSTNGRLVVFWKMTKNEKKKDPVNGSYSASSSYSSNSPEDIEDGGEVMNAPGNEGGANATNAPSGGGVSNASYNWSVYEGEPSRPSGNGSVLNDGRDGEEEIITSDIEDEEVPLAAFVNIFKPRGNSYGYRCWALVNLLTILVSLYILIPLFHVRAKYGRIKMMKKVNKIKEEYRMSQELSEREILERKIIEENAKKAREMDEAAAQNERPIPEDTTDNDEITEKEFNKAVNDLYYHVREFVREFKSGIVSELLILIVSIIVFILTEDIRLPMVLIDKWTPLMILFVVICWLVDINLISYGEDIELEKIEKELKAQNA